MATPKQLIKRAGSHKTAEVSLTPAGLKLMEDMAAQGQDQRTIAKKLGINRKTLSDIVKRSPEAEEALERGHALLGDELTHCLLTAARKGQWAAAIYLTKARLGWREGDKAETRPNIVINLPDSSTPEAYLKLIQQTHTALPLPKPKDGDE